MELNDIYKYADKKKIKVYGNTHISNKAFCISVKNIKAISMDYGKIESVKEEKHILAEEIAHLENDLLYHVNDCINPIARQNVEKAEYKAQDCAASQLVPLKELKKLLKKHTDIFELAEILEVDAKVVLRAIDFYKRKQLL